ncbi:MAG TPA: RNA polymerase sigma-70 factor [Flavobacteriia bacterium]|nr:RNA polymerase sigma-70 factor [Flavobacteriia bacterium]
MFKDLKNICKSSVFKEVYFLYAKSLKSFLIFKYQNIEQAEDIVQDAFIKLWENCKNVPFLKAKSYLYTIANNAFLNIKKHEQVKRKHQETITQKSTNESPEFVLLEKEFYQKLKKVISNLPQKQQEVFKMSRIEKLKYREIAEQLNISVKAVEKRMSMALKTIRKEIDSI